MTNKKYLVLAIIAVAATLVVLVILSRDESRDLTSNISKSGLNLSGPTDEEKQAGDVQKQKQEQEPSTRSASNEAKPVITSAGQYDNPQYGKVIEVRALVTGVYESGGKCTATLKLGQAIVTRAVEALQDATTTRCDVVIIPRVEFPTAGEWELVVSYSSAAYSGKSDVTQVKVQ